jgi:xanthine/uracil/vitamin C permease (AzgA family)
MKILGLQLRRPTSQSFTLAAAITTMIWVFLVGMLDNLPGGTDAITAGEALVAIFWGTLCSALGISFRHARELVFFGGGCALLLGVFHGLVFLYA